MFRPVRWLHLSVVLLSGSLLWADTAAFDLAGPRIELRVTRAGKTLPISKVPNLQAGDRLWIHPDLPDGESVRFLMISVFLRGSTNPPPEGWFTKTETWNKHVRQEGIVITVPEGAQQALIFLAPQTGGDFGALRAAVQGRPGAFVRASQDLNQASLDRSRLDRYLSAVREMSNSDSTALRERSLLLARSLNIKVDNDCFYKPRQQQESCLTQNTDQLVLDDGHSQSMVAALTSGSGPDLVGQLSTTRLAGGGAYSPYVGAVVDLAKMMESFHTPEYRYIPALALPHLDELNLKLNNPPSFRKPMSVMVLSLPAVEAPQLPPLRPVDSNHTLCLEKPSLLLAAEGAPVVFATDYAHDLTLRVPDKSGHAIDLLATPDAARGGFVIDTRAAAPDRLEREVIGTIRGKWGFEPLDGPAFHLQNAHPDNWTLASADENALIVGRENTIHFKSDAAACVDAVTLKNEQGKPIEATWSSPAGNELEVKVPLKEERPGKITMLVRQYGVSKADEVELHSYAEAAHLDKLKINAGDSDATLIGTRLDQVAAVELNGVRFAPAALARVDTKDELRLSAAAGDASTLHAGDEVTARTSLKDGRVLTLVAGIDPPRPKVTLLNKNIQPGPSPSPIQLGNQDELPQGGRLSFFLKAEVPDRFSRTHKIEVATTDGSYNIFLSLDDGSLLAQDAQTVMATLDPLKSFGPSAFGPLRFRAVDGNLKGDWQPLATLVRLPALKEVRCPDSPDKQCTLTGSNLFLISSVGSDPEFKHSVPVPEGFADSTLSVPHPDNSLLYIKLRDDSSSANPVALPILPEAQ
ncbi:MAG TPA: hypothetical protein VEU11_15190 [Terriglobales bacterium]|nr:hypothetical protein [Terriglobales bacterium]